MRLAMAPPRMHTLLSAAASLGVKRATNTSNGSRMPPPPAHISACLEHDSLPQLQLECVR